MMRTGSGLAAVVVAALGVAGPACAGPDFEIAGGVASANTLRLDDSYLNAGAVEATMLFDQKRWDISVGFIGAQAGDTIDEYAYVSAQRVMRFGEILPLDLYLGVGLMARERDDNVEELLPQWWNFSLSLGLDVGRFRVELRHASNAGLQEPNRGQNWLLIGWAFGGTGH